MYLAFVSFTFLEEKTLWAEVNCVSAEGPLACGCEGTFLQGRFAWLVRKNILHSITSSCQQLSHFRGVNSLLRVVQIEASPVVGLRGAHGSVVLHPCSEAGAWQASGPCWGNLFGGQLLSPFQISSMRKVFPLLLVKSAKVQLLEK